MHRINAQSSSNELAQMLLHVIQPIPHGTVASYGQIAKLAGLPKHARMVGRILGQLEAGHSIPWHRVVNAQGKIQTVKLDEFGQNMQQALLLQEDVVVLNGKVNMKKFAWIP